MGVLARTDVQTFDRTHMYETKSYAQRSKRSDCRIHGGDCGSMASPCGAIDFYSLDGGSYAAVAVYCKSSIKRLRGWACRHLIGPACMSKKIVPPEDIHAARPDY